MRKVNIEINMDEKLFSLREIFDYLGIDKETIIKGLQNHKPEKSINHNWKTIISVLSETKASTPAEVSRITGIKRDTTKTCLRRMVEKKIVNNENGVYSILN